MKQFTTLKVGYTAGIYGCSNEYFNCIFVNETGIHSLPFYGMYGSEERIARAFLAKGYEQIYTATDYGKMKTREVWSGFLYEKQALEEISKIIFI